MFKINKNLKLKELRELKEGKVKTVNATEGLVNALSNSIEFIPMNTPLGKNDVELQLGLIVRTMDDDTMVVYPNTGKTMIETPVLKNPFVPTEGYFLFMYTLQHIMDVNFKFSLNAIKDTIMYPTLLTYEEGVYKLVFTLYLKDMDKFECTIPHSILKLKNKHTFTCGSELDKIVLDTQKMVFTE